MNAFWRETLHYSAARLFSAAASVVVLFATARALGPDGRGVLVTAVTWVTAFATLAALSLGQVCHHQIQERRSSNWLPGLLGTMVTVGGIACVLAYSGLLWLVARWGLGGISLPIVATAGLMIPLLVFDEYARNLLAATDSLKAYSRAQFIGNTLRLLFVWLAIGPLGWGVFGVLVSLIASQLVIAVLEGGKLLHQAGGKVSFDVQHARPLLASALRLHPNTVASFVLIYANILLLAELVSSAAVAWYQFALQLLTALLLVPQGAATVMLAEIARNGPDAAWPRHRNVVGKALLVVALLGIALGLCAAPMIELLAGSDFVPAANLLRWLLPAVLGMALAELLAPQWYSRGLFLTATALTCASALAHVALNWCLIQRHGIFGAVIGTSISYVAIVAAAQIAFALWCESRHRKFSRSPASAMLRSSSGSRTA